MRVYGLRGSGANGLKRGPTTPQPNNSIVLLVSILTLLTFVIQYTFRGLDDNRLTSWQWVFMQVQAWKIYLIITISILFSYISSRYLIPLLEGLRFYNKPLILFIVSFLVIIPFWQEPEVIVDTSRYFTQAKHLGIYGIEYFLKEWGKGIMVWTDMPLIPFIYGLIFRFLGEHRIYIQIFNTLIFSLTLVITYLIGRTLWDEDKGFYGGLLLLGIPYIFTQVPLMLVDIHVMFLLTLSIYTFIYAIEYGGKWIVFSSLSIFLAFFSKYSIWLMMSALLIIFLIYLLKGHSYKRGVYVFLISILMIGIFFAYKYDTFIVQIRLLFEYQRPGLRRWTEGFISTSLFQTHPFITAFALYSGYVAFKKRDLKYVMIAYLITIAIVFQIKRIRYILPLFPMFSLMASYGMWQIDVRLKRFILMCILTSSLIIAVFTYLPFIKDTSMVNLKRGGEFLNSLNIETAEVITLNEYNSPVNQAVSVSILDLFTQKRLVYHYESGILPSKEEIEKSPLRFTWEYKNPVYYEDRNIEGDALVVISGGNNEETPEYVRRRIGRYRNRTVFNISEGVFQYRISLIIYY